MVYDDALLERWRLHQGQQIADEITADDGAQEILLAMLVRAVQWCLATQNLIRGFWQFTPKRALNYLRRHPDPRVAALIQEVSAGRPFLEALIYQGEYPPVLPPRLTEQEVNWRSWRLHHAAAIAAAMTAGAKIWEAAVDIRLFANRLHIWVYLPGKVGSAAVVLMTQNTLPVFCANAIWQECAEVPELSADARPRVKSAA